MKNKVLDLEWRKKDDKQMDRNYAWVLTSCKVIATHLLGFVCPKYQYVSKSSRVDEIE